MDFFTIAAQIHVNHNMTIIGPVALLVFLKGMEHPAEKPSVGFDSYVTQAFSQYIYHSNAIKLRFFFHSYYPNNKMTRETILPKQSIGGSPRSG